MTTEKPFDAVKYMREQREIEQKTQFDDTDRNSGLF